MFAACLLDRTGWSLKQDPEWTPPGLQRPIVLQHTSGAELFITPGVVGWIYFNDTNGSRHEMRVALAHGMGIDAMLDHLKNVSDAAAQARLLSAHQQIFGMLLDICAQGRWTYSRALSPNAQHNTGSSYRYSDPWNQNAPPSAEAQARFKDVRQDMDAVMAAIRNDCFLSPNDRGKLPIWSSLNTMTWDMPKTFHARLAAIHASREKLAGFSTL